MKAFGPTILATFLAIAPVAYAAEQPTHTYLPASAVEQLQQTSVIVEGATGDKVKSTIYVFMDPNCIFCHYAWEAFQPYEAVGLQVRWIPLGFLKADSQGKAAALFDAADAVARERNEVRGSHRIGWHQARESYFVLGPVEAEQELEPVQGYGLRRHAYD